MGEQAIGHDTHLIERAHHGSTRLVAQRLSPNAERSSSAAMRAGFGVRVGLAAGPIAAGSVGSKDRQAFTVYGNTVNRAARLEALGKRLDAATIADERIARAGADLKPRGAFELAGFDELMPVWSTPNAGSANLTAQPLAAEGSSGATLVTANTNEPRPTHTQSAIAAQLEE